MEGISRAGAGSAPHFLGLRNGYAEGDGHHIGKRALPCIGVQRPASEDVIGYCADGQRAAAVGGSGGEGVAAVSVVNGNDHGKRSFRVFTSTLLHNTWYFSTKII